jgi:hypothetical protein
MNNYCGAFKDKHGTTSQPVIRSYQPGENGNGVMLTKIYEIIFG